MNISVEITDYLPSNDSLAIGNVIINNSVAVEGIHLCINLDKDKGRYYLKCTADQYNEINRLDQKKEIKLFMNS